MNIEEMKRIKIERGYSNEQVAQLSGVPLGTVQKIFAGITKRPRYDTLQALEKVFRSEVGAAHNQANSGTQIRLASDTAASASLQKNDSPIDDASSSVCESAFAYGSASSRKKQGEYTLDDYYALPDERRAELIDGVIYDMTAPTRLHQFLTGEIFSALRAYIRSNGGKCVPFMAPSDVKLDQNGKTVVQPDVYVLCHPEHNEGSPQQRPKGIPDFIAEILSSSTKRKDSLIKLKKYADAGVREYWLVDPDKKRVVVYLFEENDICPAIYSFTDKIPVAIFDGKCQIDFAEISEYISVISENMDELFDD